MISKELLSEVLGLEVKYIEECEHRENIIGIWNNINSTPIKEINIHELIFKCKTHFARLGYVVGNDLDNITIWSITKRKIIKQYEVYYEDYLEYEFKACQWILDNK